MAQFLDIYETLCFSYNMHDLYLMCLCSLRAALLAGDVGVLLLFAAIGRRGHGEGLSPPELLSTAWPFITGTPPVIILSVLGQELTCSLLDGLCPVEGWGQATACRRLVKHT